MGLRPEEEYHIVKGISKDAPWAAESSFVALSVLPSDDNVDPSLKLNDIPALCWVKNEIRGALLPEEYRQHRQTLMAELNGVFVHVRVEEGRVRIVMSDRRLP